MRRLKALALLLLAGFLAFAQPGTLILLAVVIGSWFGSEAAAITIFLVGCAVGARWIVIRARRAHDRRESAGDR